MKAIDPKRKLEQIKNEPDKLIYATVALMLVVMAVIIGVTAAYNRARRGRGEPVITDGTVDTATADTTRAPIALTDEPATGEATAPVTTEPAETAPHRKRRYRPTGGARERRRDQAPQPRRAAPFPYHERLPHPYGHRYLRARGRGGGLHRRRNRQRDMERSHDGKMREHCPQRRPRNNYEKP